MSNVANVKLKWQEHLNAVWVNEECSSVTTQDGTDNLYGKLITNQELFVLPQQVRIDMIPCPKTW